MKDRLRDIGAGILTGVLASSAMGAGATAEASNTQLCDWANPVPYNIPASPNTQILQDVSREYVEGDITFKNHPETPDSDPNTFQVVFIELPVAADLQVVAPWGGTEYREPGCATTTQWETVIGIEIRDTQLARPENQPTISWTINRP